MSKATPRPLEALLRELPNPAPPQLWQRIEASLDAAAPAAQARQSGWGWPQGRWLGLLAACSAALFLWFEAMQPPAVVDTPSSEAPALAQMDRNTMQLQQLSAQLEKELNQRRARSTRYDDEVALREAMLSAALDDIDQALAGSRNAGHEQTLWTQRVALLAGLNEQATDPLPLGRVDWVQVD